MNLGFDEWIPQTENLLTICIQKGKNAKQGKTSL